MPSGRYATLSSGERLETSNPDQTRILSHTNFDDFQNQLHLLREETDLIIEQLGRPTAVLTHETNFQSVAANFAERDVQLSKCSEKLRMTIDKLDKEITSEEKELEMKGVKSFDTELKKLEREKLRTFKQIVDKELRREEFFKEKVMEVYLATCVNNELNAATPTEV